eukprot:c38850_g1_i1.p1 GENE.c38850_g1_i1~~c38850_g1_i1.p1  ORF type:complete len:336 (-),score=30.05 c38850_g1_i1:67-1074(-)
MGPGVGMSRRLERSLACLKQSLLQSGVSKYDIDRAIRSAGLGQINSAEGHSEAFFVQLDGNVSAGEVVVVMSPSGTSFEVEVPPGTKAGTILKVRIPSSISSSSLSSMSDIRDSPPALDFDIDNLQSVSEVGVPQNDDFLPWHAPHPHAFPPSQLYPDPNYQGNHHYHPHVHPQQVHHQPYHPYHSAQHSQYHPHHAPVHPAPPRLHNVPQPHVEPRPPAPSPSHQSVTESNLEKIGMQPLFGNPKILLRGQPLQATNYSWWIDAGVRVVRDVFDSKGEIRSHIYSRAAISPQLLRELENICIAIPMRWRDAMHSGQTKPQQHANNSAPLRGVRL